MMATYCEPFINTDAIYYDENTSEHEWKIEQFKAIQAKVTFIFKDITLKLYPSFNIKYLIKFLSAVIKQFCIHFPII